MVKTRPIDDVDHDDKFQDSIKQQQKKYEQVPPWLWPVPDYIPLYIKPLSNWHELSALPEHVDSANPYEIFSLFFTDELLDAIARHTNGYAAIKVEPLQEHARPWIDTTPREILAYIGVYVYMGLHPASDVAAYWNTDMWSGPIHRLPRTYIDFERWQQLDHFLHIPEPERSQQPQSPKPKRLRKADPGLDLLLTELKHDYQYQNADNNLYACLSAEGKIVHFAWKDEGFVLFMSTVCKEDEPAKRRRKRPAVTTTANDGFAIPNRVLYNRQIPKFIDLYSHFTDIADRPAKLQVYYNHHGMWSKPWRPLWHWPLDVAVIRSYELSAYALPHKHPDRPRNGKRGSKRHVFGEDLANQLFERLEKLSNSRDEESTVAAAVIKLENDIKEQKPCIKSE